MLFKAEALVQYHFKVDPDGLSDEQFSKYWQRLRFALDFEAKRFSLKDGDSLKL